MHQTAEPRTREGDLKILLRETEVALSEIALKTGEKTLDDLLQRLRAAIAGEAQVGARVAAKANRRAKQARDAARNHPFLTGGISLAIGALVAFALWDRRMER